MKKLSFEYKITIAYIFIGSLWILFSDELVFLFTNNPTQHHKLSTYKGWFYVLVTGILFFLLIKKEISRRNILYDQLLEAKRKAEETDRLKTAFLSNISHHIRTPMNSILGFIDLLENKNTSEEKHELFLKYINDRSELLLQTLNSIIEIAKIQEGLYKVEKTRFSVIELIADLLTTIKIEAEQKKNTIVHISAGNEDVNLYSDSGILKQILSHLLSNAINFTISGEISIQYISKQQELIFYIKDSGPGIPEEQQQTLFSDFMYHTGKTYNLGQGAGMGLYLSFQLSKLIDAELWLEKTGPSGSIFALKIPLQ